MKSDKDTVGSLLRVVGDLLRGDRHSRQTIARATQKSLPTADRWIEQIEGALPDVRRVREGKTSWLAYGAKPVVPTKPAAVGACVAASLAAIFEGTQHERNLKDARDYLLRLRGVSYDDLDRKFLFAPRGGEYALPEGAGHLDEIIDALLDSRLLRFDYRHNSGQEEQLVVEPLSLVIFEHQFYLLGRRKDGSLYCYRFARMNAVDAERQGFVYPTKSEYSPRTVFDPVFGIHIGDNAPVEDVEVVLSGDWAKYALGHRWHASQQTKRLPNGSVHVYLRVRVCRELETWVLGFGEFAVVAKPPVLRQNIAVRLAKAHAAYPDPVGPSLAKAAPASSRRGGASTGKGRS